MTTKTKKSVEWMLTHDKGQYKSLILKGLTGAGKTHWYKNYIRAYGKYYGEVFILTGTAEYNMDYEDMKQIDNVIVKDFSLETIGAIMRIQKKKCAKYRKKGGDAPGMLVILDDFMSFTSSTGMGKKGIAIFEELATTSRHINMSVIYAVQKIKGVLRTTIRANVTRIIFIGALDYGDCEEIFKCYVADKKFVSRDYWAKVVAEAMHESRYGICISINEVGGQTIFFDNHKYDAISEKLTYTGMKKILTMNEYYNRESGKEEDILKREIEEDMRKKRMKKGDEELPEALKGPMRGFERLGDKYF